MSTGTLLAVFTMSVIAATGIAAGGMYDVTLRGKTVARYMHAYDDSSPESRLQTYKPFLQVLDEAGKARITKDVEGKFTHHRGHYIGWSKLKHKGSTYDLWHMKKAQQVHKAFAEQKNGDDESSFVSEVNWLAGEDTVLLTERRHYDFTKPARGGYLLFTFTSKLTAAADIELNGDPEHAGIQFRPHETTTGSETIYYFPGEVADVKAARDLPWVGETYTFGDKTFTVFAFNHPDNPTGTRISAYRDYGRFGFFPVKKLKKGETLTVKYQYLVSAGVMKDVNVIHDLYCTFAGQKTPVPPLTEKWAQRKK